MDFVGEGNSSSRWNCRYQHPKRNISVCSGIDNGIPHTRAQRKMGLPYLKMLLSRKGGIGVPLLEHQL